MQGSLSLSLLILFDDIFVLFKRFFLSFRLLIEILDFIYFSHLSKFVLNSFLTILYFILSYVKSFNESHRVVGFLKVLFQHSIPRTY